MLRSPPLDYDLYRRQYAALCTGDPRQDRYWEQQAQETHALAVVDALLDLHLKAISLSETVGRGEALNHLRFGVGRRVKELWLSLRSLLTHASPDRTEPMKGEEVELASRDLNVIYINIRGCLDNLAWAAWDFADQKPSPSQVGLFRETLRRNPTLAPLAQALAQFKPWERELAERRDPAAHRIPLSVAPSVLTETTREEFMSANDEWQAAQAAIFEIARRGERDLGVINAATARADEVHARLRSIGEFVPIFFHHYEEGHMPIYPTVPSDLAQLITISGLTLDFIAQQITSAA